jgi:hypothetical protein
MNCFLVPVTIRWFIKTAIAGLCFSGCGTPDRIDTVPLIDYADVIDLSQFKYDPSIEIQFYQAKARADLEAQHIYLYIQGMLTPEFPHNLYERVFKETLKGYKVSIHRTGCELQAKYDAYNKILDSFLAARYGVDFQAKLEQKLDSLRKVPVYASMDEVLEDDDYQLSSGSFH